MSVRALEVAHSVILGAIGGGEKSFCSEQTDRTSIACHDALRVASTALS